MSRFFSPTPVVAYASIAASNLDNDNDLNLLRRWCARVPIEMEILAEEIHPSEHHRPLWMEILEHIERGNIATLVVPSLYHIAGGDYIALSKFLVFLKAHDVTLKSLTEVIDSRRESKNEIIFRLIQDTKKADNVRSAR
jgi:Resolvase, N terminal domain